MTATAFATAPAPAAGPAVYPGAQPMPAEQVEAHLNRLEHLLADLEAATSSLAGSSWGPGAAPETARYLPTDSRRPLVEWMERITARLNEVAELADVADAPF